MFGDVLYQKMFVPVLLPDGSIPFSPFLDC